MRPSGSKECQRVDRNNCGKAYKKGNKHIILLCNYLAKHDLAKPYPWFICKCHTFSEAIPYLRLSAKSMNVMALFILPFAIFSVPSYKSL
nr:MAG TPA_asm: hypothetical protein [Caudoviricetes sp.]